MAKGLIACTFSNFGLFTPLPMRKPKPNRALETLISEEVVVDACTSEERAMSWYYYPEEKLAFPFKAKCTVARAVSPLKIGEQVDVLAMPKEDDCMGEMLVMISFAGRRLGVPLAQLEVMKAKGGTREAVEDWCSWKSRGYEF